MDSTLNRRLHSARTERLRARRRRAANRRMRAVDLDWVAGYQPPPQLALPPARKVVKPSLRQRLRAWLRKGFTNPPDAQRKLIKYRRYQQWR
jgi:hypothetical protein